MTVLLDDVRRSAYPAEVTRPRLRNGVACLQSYRQYHTTDRAVAEAEAAKLLSPHSLRLSRGNAGIDAALSYASLGPVSVYLMDYHSPVSIDRPSQQDYMAVLTPTDGHLLVRHQKQEFVAGPSHVQAAVSGGDSVHMEFSEDCALLSLRAEMPALEEAMRLLAPHASGPLRFESVVANPRSCQAISGTLAYLTSTLDGFGSVSAIPSHLSRQLREHALNTILLAVPHNHSAEIFSPPPPSGRVVRQAVDLVTAETMGDLTVSDVAKQLGVGIRTLEAGFKRDLQCTPRSFMRNIRLERAHWELQDADPYSGATVTDIALRWGFAHTGRFATAYRTKYGVPPSQTLKAGLAMAGVPSGR